MQTTVNAGAEALKEISKEKARMFGKKVEAPSALEHAALAWEKKREAEARQRQREAHEKEKSSGLSFHKAIAKEVVDYDKQKLANLSRAESKNEAGWIQFNLWTKEQEGKKPKQIPLNMATVVAIRKKLIALEWARALGKSTRDTRLYDLERQATDWYRKREEEKRKKEEIAARVEKHKKTLKEILTEFAKTLREKKEGTTGPFRAESRAEVEQFRMRQKAMDPKNLAVLMEESLADAGEVFDIEWQENGCLIWIEPWEEKKLRRISGFDIPVIYRARIDENLEVSSYEEVEDEEIRLKVNEQMLANQLNQLDESPDEDLLGADEDIEGALEKKLADVGRLVELKRLDENAWVATVELWEQMRIRNIERKGEGPIETEAILAKVVDGTITTSVIKGNKSLEEKATEGSTERSERVTEGCPANSGEESKFELGTAPQK